MTRFTARARWMLIPLVLLALLATACGSSSSKSADKTTTTKAAATTTAAKVTGTLAGSGSSFVAPFIEQAATAFTSQNPGLTINYNPTGSGAGQVDLQGKLVDFAGSDSLVASTDTAKFTGGPFLYFPTVAAPITISYNLAGVTELQLSPDTLAGIFSRKITSWDDAAIKTDNPKATLPATPIVVVHRSDASGTTANFTKYLTKASPTGWALGTGTTVAWDPSTTGQAKNGGVAAAIKSTAGAVGYVDFADAKTAGLVFASIKNSSGKFIVPSVDGASAAIAGATVAPDLTYDPLNATGATAYPITSPTYALVYATQTDKTKGTALKAFLNFILTTGQKAAPQINYAPLPTSLAKKAIAQLDKIVVPSA